MVKNQNDYLRRIMTKPFSLNVIIMLFVLFCVGGLRAQFSGILGVDSLGSSSGKDYLGQFYQLPNGNVLLAGRTEKSRNLESLSVNRQAHWIEFRPNGKIQRSRLLGIRDITDLAPSRDGNFYVSGEGNGFKTTSGYCKSDLVVAKLSPEGRRIWSRSYGNAIHKGSDGGRFVKELSNGDVLVVGNIYESQSRSNVLVARLDSQGEPVWTKSYGASGNQYALTGIELPNGDLWIGAQAMGGAHLLILDSSGQLKSARNLNTQGGIVKLLTRRNMIYAVGDIMIDQQSRWYVAQFNTDGQVLWAKTYQPESSGPVHAISYDAALLPSGDIVVAGYYFAPSRREEESGVVLRLNPQGQLMWARKLETNTWVRRLQWNGQHIVLGMQYHVNDSRFAPDIGIQLLNADGSGPCSEFLQIKYGTYSASPVSTVCYEFSNIETGQYSFGFVNAVFAISGYCPMPVVLTADVPAVSSSSQQSMYWNIDGRQLIVQAEHIPDAILNMFDFSGRKVWSGQLHNGKASIDSGSLNRGIYLIWAYGQQHTEVIRIVIP